MGFEGFKGESLNKGLSLFKFLNSKANWIIYFLTAFFVVLATKMRTANLDFLKDVTTGKYISLALDPYLFQRYGQDLAQTGSLIIPDMLRSAPIGADIPANISLIPYMNYFIYKISSFFNPSITFDFIHVIYPVIFFFLSMIVFFLLVDRLFNKRTAMIATALLAFFPSFLYRTTAGFSDKEPMGVFFMFTAFYLFVLSWQARSNKLTILLGALSGLSTILLWLTWGGVKFVFLIFGLYMIVEFFLGKVEKKDILSYSSWFLVSILTLVFMFGQSVTGLFTSITTAFSVFAFFLITVDWLVFKKNLWRLGRGIESFVKGRLPMPIVTLCLTLIFALVMLFVFLGPSTIADIFRSIYSGLLETMQVGRVAVTVAEQRQPYIIDWINEFGALFFWMFFLGSILLFNEMLKPLKKYAKYLTIGYTLFLFAFIFSRYSSGSNVLNGSTPFSKFLYLGSLIAFALLIVGAYLIAYYKKNKVLSKISKIDKKYTFVFIWFLLLIVAARSAIRLIFIFSPIICLIAAHFISSLYEKGKSASNKYVKILLILSVILLLVLPVRGTLVNYMGQTNNAVSVSGPSYGIQWQHGMEWVRDNTLEDAIFAHWWDYGYWIQTGGRRATITDGGHNVGYWDYLVGRHVLTAQNETEALEFLISHNATHLLIISDEIGKYSAYSSIGSDESYDRFSWLSTFHLDNSRSVERRDDSLLFYGGGFVLDEDLIWEDELYPKNSAGIGAFLLPAVMSNEGGSVGQPIAIIVYSGKQVQIPVKCVYVEGQEINFPGEGLDGCLKLIMRVDGNIQEPIGAAIYISERVKRTLFSDLFLLERKSENFKLAYDDEQRILSYNGRLIGPLKMWEISYPEDIKPKDEYIQTTIPEELIAVTQR